MANPAISIVTICYNSAEHVEETIRSVLSQTYSNIEYIVVDGGSSDGTVDIIRSYEYGIATWVSEPDEGIADAMNKGIALATGDYVLFLHSDDRLLAEGSIASAVEYMQQDFNIFAFSLYFELDNSLTLARPKRWGLWMNVKTCLLHQAVFCRRRLFNEIGVFDDRFRIAMDYEFFLRAYRRNVDVGVVDFPISVMRKTGISSRTDPDSLAERFREEKLIHFRHCQSIMQRLLYTIYWFFYPLYRRSRL